MFNSSRQVREPSLSHRGPKIGAAPSKRAAWGPLLKKIGIDLGIGTASTVAGYAALDAITGPSSSASQPPATDATPGTSPDGSGASPGPQTSGYGPGPEITGPVPGPQTSGPPPGPQTSGPAPGPQNSGSAPPQSWGLNAPPQSSWGSNAPPQNSGSSSSIFGELDL